MKVALSVSIASMPASFPFLEFILEEEGWKGELS